MNGIRGTGPGDVWAVGSGGTAQHWDGSRWSTVATDTLDHLRSVWGTSPADVWAVGDHGTILHWDGVRWSRQASGTTNDLRGVTVTGAGEVWAVGGHVSDPLVTDNAAGTVLRRTTTR